MTDRGNSLVEKIWDYNKRLNYKIKSKRFFVKYFNIDIGPEEYVTVFHDRLKTRTDTTKLTIVHFIGSLSAGGAERQLVNLAIEQKKNGHRPVVLTQMELEGAYAHYLKLLEEASVEVWQVGMRTTTNIKREILCDLKLLRCLNRIPVLFNNGVIELYGELKSLKTMVLHSWLDQTNIIASIVTRLVDIPLTIVSTRNTVPDNIPQLANPIYLPWYQMTVVKQGIMLINNSIQGARDYADWLGIPVSQVVIVKNGVNLICNSKKTVDVSEKIKAKYKIGPACKIIMGVFRFSEEKNPLLFIDVCLKVISAMPDVVVLIAGAGRLEGLMREKIRASSAVENFYFLGYVEDVQPLYLAADLLLHTSTFEGMPNAVLEAQACGCPVVVTSAGGTPDALVHNETGLVTEVYDTQGLVNAVLNLLNNDEKRSQFGEMAREFIQKNYSLKAMVDATDKLYESALRAG